MPETAPGMRRLAWTLAGLAAAVAPHVMHLRPWVTALALSLAAWRVLAERRAWRLPGRLLRGTVVIAVTAGIILSYRGWAGLDAGTALLVLMAALKLLETRTARDHTVLVFIGWFWLLRKMVRIGRAQRITSTNPVPPAAHDRISVPLIVAS